MLRVAMRWIEFARSHGGETVSGLPGAALRRIAEAIDAGKDIVEVAREESRRPEGGLPPSVLVRLFDLEERRRGWERAAERLVRERAAAGLQPLGEALVAAVGDAAAVAALGRAAACAPGATAIELREIASTWHACFDLAWRNGVIRVGVCPGVAEKDADARYQGARGRACSPDSMPPGLWLTIRRGERDGAFEVTMAFPVEEMEQWVRGALGRFGAEMAGRHPREILDRVVLGDLEAEIRRRLDERGEQQAIEEAAAAYAVLFRTPPVRAERIGAAYVGRGPRRVSWVVAGADGAPIESGSEAIPASPMQGSLPAGRSRSRSGSAAARARSGDPTPADRWAVDLVDRLVALGVQVLVLPAESPVEEWIDAMLGAAGGRLSVSRVQATAIKEAREALRGSDTKLQAGQADALILLRRALDPVGAFGALDPMSLCVMECRHELDPGRVEKHLRIARALAELEAERAAAVRSAQAAASAIRPAAPANPGTGGSPPGAIPGQAPAQDGPAPGPPVVTVSSIDEIRPGMRLAGTVTKISSFGAFVNIGLRQDGLVHLSELADRHVTDPTTVVRPGQQVRVRVVAVDRARNRISLSMRSEGPRPPKQGGAGNRVRSAALRELDKLFKK